LRIIERADASDQISLTVVTPSALARVNYLELLLDPALPPRLSKLRANARVDNVSLPLDDARFLD